MWSSITQPAHVSLGSLTSKPVPPTCTPHWAGLSTAPLGECGLGTTVSYAQEGSSFFSLENYITRCISRPNLQERNSARIENDWGFLLGSDIFYSIREDTQCGSCFIVDSYFAWSSHTFHSVSFIHLQIMKGDLTHIRHCVKAPVTS